MIPGPSVLMVISYSLQKGRSSALSTGPGIVLGDLTAMVCSFLGIGAMLATSAFLFSALKFIGAGYLLFLGVTMWRKSGKIDFSTERMVDESKIKSFSRPT